MTGEPRTTAASAGPGAPRRPSTAPAALSLADLSLVPIDTDGPTGAAPAPGAADAAPQDCPRCHYRRQPSDTAAAWQCPRCGVAYSKARAPAPASPRTAAEASGAVAAGASRRPRSEAPMAAAGMPAQRAKTLRDWPWTWLALLGAAAVLGGLLVWKSGHDRQRAADRAARQEADARAAQVAQVREAQDLDTRINDLHRTWRGSQGVDELPAVRALAEAGHARAMVLLATMLTESRGIPRNRPEAVRWLEQAAGSGSALAAVRLGALYEQAGDSEPRQLSRAENWYLRAARQGDASALYSLGALYARGGDAVLQRPIDAWMLLELAARAQAAQGPEDPLLPPGHSAFASRSAQARLTATLGTHDTAEAKRRADAWKPGQPLGI
ncbi:sel1 repeat family protein [Acidovorax sp. GBBC 3334]|uniref:tetratricopeptide repeat protein n=1 Tax=Acidovorax sp. GBBC 3334 TaxID=2940496 RepID=UPI0023025C15|nr:tetratricopeptide repeat protein [Acidovorax sp. GBBC 3334]MDA8455331.1 sel1 repeat family protein [Acidovorax sp. GBBC 3334]